MKYAVMVFVDGRGRITAKAFAPGTEPTQTAALVIDASSADEAAALGCSKVKSDIGGSLGGNSGSKIFVP